MIKRIFIDNYRNFKNFELNFDQPITVLCGLNGTGKSSLFEVIEKLQNFVVNNEKIRSVCDFTDIPAWLLAPTGFVDSHFSLTIDAEGEEFEYTVVIRLNLHDKISRIEEESLKINNKIIYQVKKGSALIYRDNNISDQFPVDWSVSSLDTVARVVDKVASFIKYMSNLFYIISLNPSAISALVTESHSFSNRILCMDGSNFASWYAEKMDDDPSLMFQAFKEFKNFIPWFSTLKFSKGTRDKELRAVIRGDRIESEQEYNLSFEQLSSGQKILIVLYTILYTSTKNACLCIDEFENYLSPVEVQPMYDALTDLCEERNSSVILISHAERTLSWYSENAIRFSTVGFPPFVKTMKVNTPVHSLYDDSTFDKRSLMGTVAEAVFTRI